MTTIAKNRIKKIDEIFAATTNCRVFTLDNYFNGKDCGKEWAKKELFQFSFAKLQQVSPTQYHVDVTSNCWYEMTVPEAV